MVLGKRGMLSFGLIIPEGGRVAKYGSKGLAVLTPLLRIIDDATVQAHSEKGVSYQLQFHFNESIQRTQLFEPG